MKTELEKKAMKRLSNAEANRLTRECLQIALIKLMAEKDFEKITVTEITGLAGVSRTAFYRNYESKEAIVEDACENVLTRLRESLERFSGDLGGWYESIFRVLEETLPSCHSLRGVSDSNTG